jgi:hypothetical protein
MRKLIVALAFTAITTPAWSDATETIDAKTAADSFCPLVCPQWTT